MSGINQNKKENSSKGKRVYLVDKYICNFIASEWISEQISDREQAKKFGIHHNLIKKIKEEDGYKIPASTLATICFYKGIKVSDFFKTLENKYGTKINDDFIIK